MFFSCAENLHFTLPKQSPGDSLQKDFCEKFRKIHRKTPVPESLFSKFAGLRTATLLKRDSNRCFPVNFAKCLRTPFFKEHLLMVASNLVHYINNSK